MIGNVAIGLPWILLLTWLVAFVPLYWPAVVLAALVFFSQSLSTSLLLMLSLNVTSFIYSMNASTNRGLNKKISVLQIVGTGIALMGAGFKGNPLSVVAVFLGLLLSFPSILVVATFRKYYEALSVDSFLVAVALPGFAAIEIIFKVRPELTVQFPKAWETGLVVLGLLSFFHASVLVFMSKEVGQLIKNLNFCWLGLLLFALALDAQGVEHLLLAMIAVFVVLSSVLTEKVTACESPLCPLTPLVWLGFPGLIGFSVFYYAFKLAIGFSGFSAAIIAIGMALQGLALLRQKKNNRGSVNLKTNLAVLVNFLMQLLFGVFFFLAGGGAVR